MKTTGWCLSNLKTVACALLLASLWAGPLKARAALIIEVGDTLVQPGQATSPALIIQVNNDGAPIEVGGLDFFVEVEVAGPRIQSVDLTTGTIFASNAVQAPGGANTDHKQQYAVVSFPGRFVPNGLSRVATLTFDTTGISVGTYFLHLSGVDFGTGPNDTQYVNPTGTSDIAITINNGNLVVVPEPSAAACLAALGCLGVAGFRLFQWRRKDCGGGRVWLNVRWAQWPRRQCRESHEPIADQLYCDLAPGVAR